MYYFFFFFQAEDGIRDLVRSRGLGDVYKRQETSDAAESKQYHVSWLKISGIFHHKIAKFFVQKLLSLIHI